MKSADRKLIPVILAGGSGTRLWPLSRAANPKQFLSLFSDKTMLQETVERLTMLSTEKPVTICNEEHRFLVAEQLREIDSLGPIILEPFGRNTAPAIALAALLEENPSALLLVLPADHVIEDQDGFAEVVELAIPLAEKGRLVTFGVTPDKAHVGYGYIKVAESIGHAFNVESFKEKPDHETAKKYIDAGGYYWNSVVFLFRVDRYLEELQKFCPDIIESCRMATANTKSDMDFLRLDVEAFKRCPDNSIDYGVMEKTSDAVVVPMGVKWSDVGDWSSLWEISPKGDNGNFVSGDVILQDSSNSYVRTDDKLVAVVGIDNLIVVSTKDAVMVSHKDRVQDVKQIVSELKRTGRGEWQLQREVYRPWGKYDSIDKGERYQVKRITVNPGAKLSVQMHHHRAEHWIVVSGLAKVTNGEKVFFLAENESTYIPLGVVHSLENPGKVALEIIEIQSGGYLGEDDIVRFDDKYGRI